MTSCHFFRARGGPRGGTISGGPNALNEASGVDRLRYPLGETQKKPLKNSFLTSGVGLAGGDGGCAGKPHVGQEGRQAIRTPLQRSPC